MRARAARRRGDREDSNRVIQNIIAILIGSGVSLIALWLLKADSVEEYITALVIGGIGNFAWPLVAAIWLGRRAKQRREEQIQKEVDKQISAQGKR